MSQPLFVRDGVVIPAGELTWTAVRASGPGGQNVNKVSSKVHLRFALARSTALDDAVKARLRAMFGSRIDAQGDLCVVSQLTRDQARNLEDARDKLRALVLAALAVPKRRKKTRPSRGARERRLGEKKHHGEKKRQRRDFGD
jgi:ribosome-associated protein